MRCFNHPTADAVAVCRNCGRGLCSNCVALTQDAAACKGRCEKQVANIQRAMESLPGQYRRNGQTSVFMGLLFVVLGGINMALARGNEFLAYTGGVFIALGLIFVIRGITTMRTLSARENRSAEIERQFTS